MSHRLLAVLVGAVLLTGSGYATSQALTSSDNKHASAASTASAHPHSSAKKAAKPKATAKASTNAKTSPKTTTKSSPGPNSTTSTFSGTDTAVCAAATAEVKGKASNSARSA